MDRSRIHRRWIVIAAVAVFVGFSTIGAAHAWLHSGDVQHAQHCGTCQWTQSASATMRSAPLSLTSLAWSPCTSVGVAAAPHQPESAPPGARAPPLLSELTPVA